MLDDVGLFIAFLDRKLTLEDRARIRTAVRTQPASIPRPIKVSEGTVYFQKSHGQLQATLGGAVVAYAYQAEPLRG